MASLPITPTPADPGHATVRGLLLLLVQRGVTIAGGLVFAAVVPHLMGPATYGRYALVTSVAASLMLIGSLGMMNVIASTVPRLALREPSRLSAFFGNLLALRLMSGVVTAVIYLAVMTTWLGDLGLATLALLSLSVIVHAMANLLFTTFLGFKQTGRWAASDGIHRWLSLALIVPAFSLGGLTGACAALLIADIALLALGAWWSRSWLTGIDFRLDLRSLAPYLRLGFAFWVTRLLAIALSASGEPLVRTFSGDYSEVGYFSLAHAMYLAAGTALSQITLLFVPVLSEFVAEGRTTDIVRWTGRLLTWLVAGSVAVVVAAAVLGKGFVALLLGPAYAPVGTNLFPLAVALFLSTVGAVLTSLANVYNRPRPAVIAGCLRLLVLGAIAPPLIADYGAWGCCVALAVAAAAHSVCLGWSMRDSLVDVLTAPMGAAILGALLLPLVWLRASVGSDVLLFAAITVAYVTLLFGCGVLKRAELKALMDTMRIGTITFRAGGSPVTPLS